MRFDRASGYFAAFSVVFLLTLCVAAFSVPPAFAANETANAACESLTDTVEDTVEDTVKNVEPGPIELSNTSEGIGASWEAVQYADMYYLYRKQKGTSVWETVASLPADSSSPGRLNVVDQTAKAGVNYDYRLQIRSALDGSMSPYGVISTCRRLLPPRGLTASASSCGTALTWNPEAGAIGYSVYRQAPGESQWELVGVTAKATESFFVDASAPSGKVCQYAATSFNGDSASVLSSPVSFCYVPAPKAVSLKRRSNTSYLVKWSKVPSATGYQVQYSQSNLFTSRRTLTGSAAASQRVITGLPSKKTYYVRVRAFAKVGRQTYYSAWHRSSNASAIRRFKPSVLKRDSKTLELRTIAKQTMYGYDTVQGSCTDGTFGYYCLYNQNKENCRIAKVRLSTKKVVKVSGVLDVGHGNDITYDSKRKRLVVAHCAGSVRRLDIVNPSTLKVSSSVNVALPQALLGATDSQRKAIRCFSGIAYCSNRDQYVVLLANPYNLLVLDGDLQPVRYATTTKKSGDIYQGIDATSDFILIATSPRTGYGNNTVLAFDWEGTYQGSLALRNLDEVESVYHVGSKFYVSVYRPYYKISYVSAKSASKSGTKLKKAAKLRKRTYTRDNYVYYVAGL